MTPVVSSNNQPLTHYYTSDVSLHGGSDISVTSVVSPLTQHYSELMAVNTSNVVSGIMSSSVVTQPLTLLGSFSNSFHRSSIMVLYTCLPVYLAVNQCCQLQGAVLEITVSHQPFSEYIVSLTDCLLVYLAIWPTKILCHNFCKCTGNKSHKMTK